jgi:signal transduction histidine kinase
VLVAVVGLSVALVGVTAWLLLLLRQVRSVTRQLARRGEEGGHRSVRVQMVSRDVDQMVAEVNGTIRTAEAAIAHARREEQQIRDLITDVSHDLRTPLTAIRGYQQLLARSALEAEQRAALDVAMRHTGELGVLVDHLYDYASLLLTGDRVEPEEVDLATLVADCLLGAIEPLEAAGLDVRFNPARSVVVTTDPGKVTRIVQNLVRNAAQHGTDLLNVRVESTADGAVCSFTNRLDPERPVDVDRLFDRFYTGDTARTRRTSGLGLSIVRALADQLGGSAAASRDGDALTLSIVLPSAVAVCD